MLEQIAHNPWLQKIRKVGLSEGISEGISLGLSKVMALPVKGNQAHLPRLEGADLARQRLHEAIAALQDSGLSQVESFCKIRVELNKLEQGRFVAAPKPEPEEQPTPRPSRRARLLRATGLY